MANPEHLEILKLGVKVWNEWRKKNPDETPDLTKVNLSGENLCEVDFSKANLLSANLSGADLSKAILYIAQLQFADLSKAKLIEANLPGTDFLHSNLSGANLSRALLYGTNLAGAQLQGAKLRKTILMHVIMNGTNLKNADFSYAIMQQNLFNFIDLSKVKGLETVRHNSRSEIGFNTIYGSRGKIPDVFLRGCGLPNTLIEYLPTLLNDPIQFYSCFVSYSSKNQLFADRLYADLQNKGVRCWLASEDLKIGEKTRIGIDQSIRLHDKLLLVLSKHSVASDWVEQEVETALDRERREKRTVLFPVRLDDTVMKVDVGWPALIKNTRNIGDFRKWRNPEAYQKAFDRLLRDLKAE
jgi:hypothetical protein